MSPLPVLFRDPPPRWAAVTALGASTLLALHTVAPANSAARHGGMAQPHGMLAAVPMSMLMASLLVSSTAARLWRRNLPRHRAFASAAFVFAYSGVWVALPAVLLPFSAQLLSTRLGLWTVIPLVIAWQCSPLKQHALNACHRSVPLRIFGVAPVLDCGFFGLRTGLLCSLACGPLMIVAMSVHRFPLMAMAGAVCIAVAERNALPRQPAWGWSLSPSVARELRLGRKRQAAARISNDRAVEPEQLSAPTGRADAAYC